MKRLLCIALSTITLCSSIIVGASYKTRAEENGTRKIVMFNKEVSDHEYKDNLLKKHGISKIKDLNLINGVTVNLNKQQENQLKDEKDIFIVEDDSKLNVMGKVPKKDTVIPYQPTQTIPWGVTKIKADMLFNDETDSIVKIAILDSGVDLTHPDLKDRIKGGYNTIKHKASINDGYGHGTHVAGIIAATNNSIGVVGVAPKSSIYPVKVIDDKGNGYASDLIEGIEWAIANGMQVINMSIGVADSQSLHDAIIKAYESGIVLVASSGNSPEESTVYPATYPEVISVSATDYNDQISDVCSKGKIDISAPGVSIYSTFKGGTYSPMTGTSMAAPHVTGVVALLLSNQSKSDLNKDGKVTPLEIKQKLQVTSKDLGPLGIDDTYGAGLLDAYRALTE